MTCPEVSAPITPRPNPPRGARLSAFYKFCPIQSVEDGEHMATLNFSIQKIPAYGSYGEFSAGTGANQIRAQYLLTKIRPGQQGTWENQLATQMAPWREIFQIEEL